MYLDTDSATAEMLSDNDVSFVATNTLYPREVDGVLLPTLLNPDSLSGATQFDASRWDSRKLFERDGKLFVIWLESDDSVGVLESTDNGLTWNAPTQETLEALIA